MSKIIDAVSIVITCGNEIFAIQRQNYLNAFPGYWAFPGGKVESDDEAWGIDYDQLDRKLLGAAVREGQEELGFDLREEIKNGNVTSIDYLGLAVTPDFNPYRFATHFFKINFSKKIPFNVDTNEAQIAEWMSAKTLLDRFKAGEILAVPPVIKVIQTLGEYPDTKSISDISFDCDKTIHVPWIESIHGVKQLMPLSHTLPPAVRTNAFLIGGTLIDPSPKDDEEYIKFKNTLLQFGADKILITHHHHDHYERSNLLARELNLPVLISQDTLNRIGTEFFRDVTVRVVKENDVVTTWLGHKVIVMEIPGHDEGQIAVYPENLSWFLAGDLFQGVGTVVIGGSEGNMKKYFHTLERIIKLSPKVLFPSHGIGLGGTNILQKTLDHRKQRESQVLALHLEGLKPEQMLAKIYAEIDQKLWPYALENINKHLDKLREEKLI